MIRMNNSRVYSRGPPLEDVNYQVDPDESVSTAVVRAVSALEGIDPCSLRPLAEVLDPESLDSLFAPRHDDTPRRGGRVSFVYAGYEVAVENAEFLTLDPIDYVPDGARGRVSADSGDR
jgi:hypothetical protein